MSSCIKNEEELEERLSIPSNNVIDMMKRIDGDILILGVAGKMGITLARTAIRAIEQAGVKKEVIGISRFSSLDAMKKLEAFGCKTIKCDLLDSEDVAKLPKVKNVIFMAGRKFGTDGSEDLTWAMNTIAPANVGDYFRDSNIVAFSTGCVYPLASVTSNGCNESIKPAPIGEYAQSCLGRERMFQYYSNKYSTPVCLFRLNYAIDLRYGVLHDIVQSIAKGEGVDLTSPQFNIIWQADANNIALACLEHCETPAKAINVTGLNKINTKETALKIGELINKKVIFKNNSGDKCYLSDASMANSLFELSTVSDEEMIELQANWIATGGVSLNKPTHFEVNNGEF